MLVLLILVKLILSVKCRWFFLEVLLIILVYIVVFATSVGLCINLPDDNCPLWFAVNYRQRWTWLQSRCRSIWSSTESWWLCYILAGWRQRWVVTMPWSMQLPACLDCWKWWRGSTPTAPDRSSALRAKSFLGDKDNEWMALHACSLACGVNTMNMNWNKAADTKRNRCQWCIVMFALNLLPVLWKVLHQVEWVIDVAIGCYFALYFLVVETI